MVWYPIQLWLENECKLYPISRIEYVEVTINGVEIQAYFKVIEIIDDTKCYLPRGV